jgi:membrane fusion protein (multidrug efflux system)
MADPALKSETAETAKPDEPVLKFPPKTSSDAEAPTRRSLTDRFKQNRRLILLVILPLLVVLAGLTFYLMGGRYISTDNAYVGAQKVLITPDIAGKVINVFVREGQHVNPGDKLLELDPVPYKLAMAQAQAKLDTVVTQFNTLKSDLDVLTRLVDFSQKNVELKKRDVERKQALVESRTGSQADLDTSTGGLVTAQLQNQLAVQRKEDTLHQLMGNPNLKLEDFPAYAQAKAVLDQAKLDLKHTLLVSPISGIATQVDNIQLGRFVSPGGPILSVVDDAAPWVDANPKETDITYLRLGQRVTINVDTFPDHVFHGSVVAISPGTGAQFSILPAQNASGNWIKVVQRVPVRIAFDQNEDVKLLRSGMSATVDIDTGRNRSIASLLGFSPKPSVNTAVP